MLTLEGATLAGFYKENFFPARSVLILGLQRTLALVGKSAVPQPEPRHGMTSACHRRLWTGVHLARGPKKDALSH